MDARQTLLAMTAVALIGGSAHAAMLSFPLSVEFSGATPPAGTAPWITATLDDGGTPGSVTLTLANTNLVGTEFIDAWYLNLDDTLDVTQLVFSAPTQVGTFSNPTISTSANAYKADGDGKYDILIDFAQSGPNRFGVGESAQFTITGIATLTVADFNFLSFPDGGHGPYLAAAHVQGIGASGNDSGWVTTPEPASAALLAAAGLTLFKRRRNG